MHISDVHDHNQEPTSVVQEFLAQDRKAQIKSVLEQLVEDEFRRLEEFANEHISEVAADRATKFLARVLNGDHDAAMALLGDQAGGSRYKLVGCDAGQPWAHLIRGELFVAGGVELRRKIVEAHADLIRNERIKDLESIVDGLTRQVRGLESDLDACRRRLSP